MKLTTPTNRAHPIATKAVPMKWTPEAGNMRICNGTSTDAITVEPTFPVRPGATDHTRILSRVGDMRSVLYIANGERLSMARTA